MNTIQRLAAAALALCGALALATPGPVRACGRREPGARRADGADRAAGRDLGDRGARRRASARARARTDDRAGGRDAGAGRQPDSQREGRRRRGRCCDRGARPACARDRGQRRRARARGNAAADGDPARQGDGRLRPDLVVTTVDVPAQTLTTRAVNVVADVEELNGETGAKAMLTLMLGPTPLAEPQSVTIPAGGSRSVTFAGVKLETAMSAELTVTLADAAPYETDATNNSRAQTVEVTEHELLRSTVLVADLGGYGAQLNNHVYAPITPWPAAGYGDVEAKVKPLQPQLVRIFYNDNWDANANGQFPDWEQNYASFVAASTSRRRRARQSSSASRTSATRAERRRTCDGEVRGRARDSSTHARERPLGRGRERAERPARAGDARRSTTRSFARSTRARRARPAQTDPPHGRRAHRERRAAPPLRLDQVDRREHGATSSTPTPSTSTGGTTGRDGSSTGCANGGTS